MIALESTQFIKRGTTDIQLAATPCLQIKRYSKKKKKYDSEGNRGGESVQEDKQGVMK